MKRLADRVAGVFVAIVTGLAAATLGFLRYAETLHSDGTFSFLGRRRVGRSGAASSVVAPVRTCRSELYAFHGGFADKWAPAMNHPLGQGRKYHGVCMNERCPQYLWKVLVDPSFQICEACGQPLYPVREEGSSPFQ